MSVLSDPFALIVCLIAVFFVGLSRGGFGGAMGMMGVPIMAIAIPPVQAAAILLPILILVDIVGLWSWRKDYDRTTLMILIPGALIGIVIAWLAAAYVSDDIVRLIVGLLCVLFVFEYAIKMVKQQGVDLPPKPHNRPWGTFWGVIAGFTSFVSHIGAPPFQVYTMPIRLSPASFAGTTIRFFFIINVIKLGPYFALGQFDTTNLSTSLLLMPLAPLATLLGVKIVKKMKPETFYPLMYALMLLAGLKLIYDAVISI